MTTATPAKEVNQVHENERWRDRVRSEERAAANFGDEFGFLVDFYDARAQVLNPNRPPSTMMTTRSFGQTATKKQTPRERKAFLSPHFNTMRTEMTREVQREGSLQFVSTNTSYGAAAATANQLEPFPRNEHARKTAKL